MVSKTKNAVKYAYPTGIQKCEILIKDTWMVLKRRNETNTGSNP